MSENMETLLKNATDEMKKVSDTVKQTAESALKEVKSLGSVTEETKQKADKALSEQTAVAASLKKIEEGLEQVSNSQHDFEQKMSARKGGGKEAPKSLGQLVAESEKVKQYVAAGAKGHIQIDVNQVITSAADSAGALIDSERETAIVGMPKRRMTIRQLLMPGRTNSNLVEYPRQKTRTNNARPVTEGGTKPESNYEYEKGEAAVRTIAHWTGVSRQAFDDAAQLASEINGELAYGLDFKEEDQLLNGDGVGENLSGLITNATAYTPAFTPTSNTRIDTLRLAILQASLAEYSADAVVLNPVDWAHIELTKDTQGRYLLANPLSLMGPVLWGRPVVDTQSMEVGDFLVGAFRMAAQIYDRMGVEISVSSEDRDNFIKNMLTVRAEKRLALAIKRPAALVHGEFTAETA